MEQTGYTVYIIDRGETIDSDHFATRRDAMRYYARLLKVYTTSTTIEVCIYRGTDLEMIRSSLTPPPSASPAVPACADHADPDAAAEQSAPHPCR